MVYNIGVTVNKLYIMIKVIEFVLETIAVVAAITGVVSLYMFVWSPTHEMAMFNTKVFVTCVITFIVAGGLANLRENL